MNAFPWLYWQKGMEKLLGGLDKITSFNPVFLFFRQKPRTFAAQNQGSDESWNVETLKSWKVETFFKHEASQGAERKSWKVELMKNEN